MQRGKTTDIVRFSTELSVTVPYDVTYRNWDNYKAPDNNETSEEFNLFGCGRRAVETFDSEWVARRIAVSNVRESSVVLHNMIPRNVGNRLMRFDWITHMTPIYPPRGNYATDMQDDVWVEILWIALGWPGSSARPFQLLRFANARYPRRQINGLSVRPNFPWRSCNSFSTLTRPRRTCTSFLQPRCSTVPKHR